MVSPKQLVQTLKSQGLRSRTGILALDVRDLGMESEIAAQLDVEFVDYRTRVLLRTPDGSKFLDLTLASILEDLDALGNEASGEVCVLLAHFDVAVSYLCSGERNHLWRRLLTDFPYRTRRLIFCVPAYQEARYTIPDLKVRELWRQSDRYARWQWNEEK